jgi:O-antigen/teichoic acid export membrane protein
LDLAGAVSASIVVLLAAPFVTHLWGMEVGFISVVLLALTALTSTSGMPTAVLRIADRHNLYSLHTVSAAALRLVALGLSARLTQNLEVCVAVWALAQIASNLALQVMGHWQAHTLGVRNIRLRLNLASFRDFPGLTRAFLETNLIQTAKGVREADILLVGALFSKEVAGFYRIARQVGDVIIKATDPLLLALYPEFARLKGDAQHVAFERVLLFTTGVILAGAALAALSFALVGTALLTLIFGPAFSSAYLATLLCVVAASVRAGGQSAASALLAQGGSREVLVITATSSGAYFVLIFAGGVLTDSPSAVAAALLATNVLATVWLILAVHRTRLSPK